MLINIPTYAHSCRRNSLKDIIHNYFQLTSHQLATNILITHTMLTQCCSSIVFLLRNVHTTFFTRFLLLPIAQPCVIISSVTSPRRRNYHTNCLLTAQAGQYVPGPGEPVYAQVNRDRKKQTTSRSDSSSTQALLGSGSDQTFVYDPLNEPIYPPVQPAGDSWV